MWYKAYFDILNILDVTHECDGQRDGQTDRHSPARMDEMASTITYMCLYRVFCLDCYVGDEVVREMSSEVERVHGWLNRRCDTAIDMSPQCDVNIDEQQPEAENDTTSGRVLNGRSPTPPIGECPQPMTTTLATATLVPEVKDSWSPEAPSRRGNWESVASDCLSDAWSSGTSVPGFEDNRMDGLDGEKDRDQSESTDAIVVSDSSPTPPPPSLVASSEPQKDAVLSPRSVAASAVSATDESVVRKLESFVESMSVRRCVKPSTISLTDAVTLSSTSGLGRQSFPVCRPLPTLNGLRDSSSGVLLPFYVPFKTSDVVDHPLDLSSKTSPVGRISTTKTADSAVTFAQGKDEGSELCDDGISSLESLQKQFGENSAMLERIGVRRHTVSGVAPLPGVGGRIHGAVSPLNGVGLYGPALNEPCVPPSCRPVPVPHPDGPAVAGGCPQTTFDATRSLPADRRSARRLVRGQDAWMNGICGRQRRSSVLRCLECNMSFWSLPELTLHMIKTAHYANIVRSSVVPGPTPEMTSSPTMTSSCSPVDSDSSRESDVDTDHYFSQATGGFADFRLAKVAKRQRESSPNGEDCSKRSKIWRPDCPLSTSHCSATVERPIFGTTSPDGRITPVCGDVDVRQPSGLEHDRAVTSSKLPEDREVVAPLYDGSPGRSEDASDDGDVTRQPALTAMEDFISRSICELDRGKRRPAMPLLPPPAPPRPPPPPNGLPPTMTVADLMFPLFPLAQFFPEQFLIASRAFNFLPLMQSLARIYGDRFPGWDVPLGAPVEFPAHKTTDDFDATRRPLRHRTPDDGGRGAGRNEDSLSKYHRINGEEPEMKLRSRSRDRHDSESLRSTSNSDGLRGLTSDVDDRRKLSPTLPHLTRDGVPSTALDSLRGFVYGDRKRSEHARAERKYSREQREGHLPHLSGSIGHDDEETVRRRPGQSPTISSGGDSVPGAPSPVGVDAPEAAAVCGGTGRTTDYDSRFDKYYRLARELAGQL